MATCKDCIHYDVCKDTWSDDNWTETTPEEIKEMFSPKGCENFKNKTDVVEVVRCKDCVYSDLIGRIEIDGVEVPCNVKCKYLYHVLGADDYCSLSKRKEVEK